MGTLEIADIVGTIAFALSGFIIATKDRLDLLGILIASFLTALGGGIIRDTIVQRTPYAFTTLIPAVLVLIVIIISIFFKLYNRSDIINNLYFIISDSVGLVSFSITGSLVGLNTDFNIIGIIFLSFTTAVGGGILRDVLLNRVPVVLISELYGTIAVVIGIVIKVLHSFNLLNELSTLLIFVFALILRLLAYFFKWHLPILSSE